MSKTNVKFAAPEENAMRKINLAVISCQLLLRSDYIGIQLMTLYKNPVTAYTNELSYSFQFFMMFIIAKWHVNTIFRKLGSFYNNDLVIIRGPNFAFTCQYSPSGLARAWPSDSRSVCFFFTFLRYKYFKRRNPASS